MAVDDDLGPIGVLGVVVIVVAILVVGQPLSGSMGGISLNWVGAVLVIVGGLSALAE